MRTEDQTSIHLLLAMIVTVFGVVSDSDYPCAVMGILDDSHYSGW